MRPPMDLPVIILTVAALGLAVRIIAWEAPLMGWHFVGMCVVSSLVFPFLAGWIAQMLEPD